MENTVFCQSCAMPLNGDQDLGTNADGSKNPEYCQYCFKDGAFAQEATMEEMIEGCVPFMLEAHPGMTAEQATEQMRGFFPQLKRWKK